MSEAIVRKSAQFRWEGVDVKEYKPAGHRHRGITRQVLLGDDNPNSDFATRYFEIAPGGHSTLEKHEHTHSVVILRGAGVVLLGNGLVRVHAPDAIEIDSWTLHQFHNDTDEPFGFLCVVAKERDRPVFASDAELTALRADPELSPWVKT